MSNKKYFLEVISELETFRRSSLFFEIFSAEKQLLEIFSVEKTFLKTFFKSSSGGILSIETFLETSDFSVLEIESGSWFCIYIDLLYQAF